MKLLTTALLCAAIFAAPAAALEPVREGQDTMISRAVFAEGKLWLLSDAGQMFTVTEGQSGRQTVPMPEPAIDLWVKDDKPAIITCPDQSCDSWTIRAWKHGAWQDIGRVAPSKDEFFLGAAEADGATHLVTSSRILTLKDGAISTVFIDGLRFRAPGRVTVVLVRPGRILVGTNAGEWGGSLIAIDRKTGRTAELCGSGGCGPVNGLVAQPGNPGCMLAAIGLIHFGPNGRILQICGTRVTRFYFRNLPCVDLPEGKIDIDCIRRKPDRDGEMPFHMEAFFGLVRARDLAWAVGVDGLYRISAQGVERTGALPKPTNYGGSWVSFAVPGIALVRTEINSRNAVSGATPMIVPR